MTLNSYKLSKNHGYSSEIASVESKFRRNRKLSAKLGQLPWTYLWIVDIFALSYQRAFSVGSTLKKTMQTMHLEGCLPHVVSLFVNRTGRIQGDTCVVFYRCCWLADSIVTNQDMCHIIFQNNPFQMARSSSLSFFCVLLRFSSAIETACRYSLFPL